MIKHSPSAISVRACMCRELPKADNVFQETIVLHRRCGKGHFTLYTERSSVLEINDNTRDSRALCKQLIGGEITALGEVMTSGEEMERVRPRTGYKI
ncbi:hypothetical protein RRG08_031474 [Elysia crispata]|uniref:Uncharacterized protein n=1 Tax=Elysia crispata TaxID=231223 RepID=A0AAE1DJU5_9GAST|nr:hypothetical protein RRG08_031474 [Elysia crispata]